MSPPVKATFFVHTLISAKISWCSPWSRSVAFGPSESEHPKLTNREIIFEDFQPTSTSQTDH